MRIPKNISQNTLIVLVSAFLVIFYNSKFFVKLVEVFPLSGKNLPYLLAISVVLFCIIVFLLSLLSTRRTLKPILIFILFCSAFAAYFMNNFGVVIDETMLQNMFETNTREMYDLLNIKLFMTVLLLGVVPSYFVYRCDVEKSTFKAAVQNKTKLLSLVLLVFIGITWLNSGFFTSFIREHKELRTYTNPLFFLDSSAKFVYHSFFEPHEAFKEIGLDASIPKGDLDRELVIMVIGETARADRFSLNGYPRKTNPLLEKEEIYNFTRFTSSGTSTTVSVPCMFSVLSRSECSKQANASTENLLDMLVHANINVMWRDNNSSSKGVANRVVYQDFKTDQLNPACDIECRDIGMLAGLDDYIKNTTTGDIFIVLHQMGSHGPAYYKRYPSEFEKFTPVCTSSQLSDCTPEEINNAYDNTILYTDYFLSEVIKFLKVYTREFETAMFYVSDHGESLGEKGLYLHGMPYTMAPQEQIHVPAILWFGESYPVNREAMLKKQSIQLSHDHIFHTALGIVEIFTEPYNRELDIQAIDAVHDKKSLSP